MKSQAFTNFSDANLAILGMFIFITFFIGVVLWVNRKGSKEIYKYSEQIPLMDGAQHE